MNYSYSVSKIRRALRVASEALIDGGIEKPIVDEAIMELETLSGNLSALESSLRYLIEIET